MSFPEGWDGKSLKEHVETAQNTADGSYDLAQTACDELESLKDEVDEKASKITLDEWQEVIQEIRDDLDEIKADFASIAAFNAPGPVTQAERMTVDDLAGQIETLGKVLSNLCPQSAGNEFGQHSHAESVGFAVRAFCDSLAMQVRGYVGPGFGDSNE